MHFLLQEESREGASGCPLYQEGPRSTEPAARTQGLGPGRGSPPSLLIPGFQGAGGHDHPKLQVRRLRPLALVLILSIYLKKKKLNIFFYSFKK